MTAVNNFVRVSCLISVLVQPTGEVMHLKLTAQLSFMLLLLNDLDRHTRKSIHNSNKHNSTTEKNTQKNNVVLQLHYQTPNNLKSLRPFIQCTMTMTYSLFGKILKFMILPFQHFTGQKSLHNLRSATSWEHVYKISHESDKPSLRSTLKLTTCPNIQNPYYLTS